MEEGPVSNTTMEEGGEEKEGGEEEEKGGPTPVEPEMTASPSIQAVIVPEGGRREDVEAGPSSLRPGEGETLLGSEAEPGEPQIERLESEVPPDASLIETFVVPEAESTEPFVEQTEDEGRGTKRKAAREVEGNKICCVKCLFTLFSPC
jgi:hypothetical protein